MFYLLFNYEQTPAQPQFRAGRTPLFRVSLPWTREFPDIYSTVEPLLTDTSLIRTVHLVPEKCPYIIYIYHVLSLCDSIYY